MRRRHRARRVPYTAAPCRSGTESCRIFVDGDLLELEGVDADLAAFLRGIERARARPASQARPAVGSKASTKNSAAPRGRPPAGFAYAGDREELRPGISDRRRIGAGGAGRAAGGVAGGHRRGTSAAGGPGRSSSPSPRRSPRRWGAWPGNAGNGRYGRADPRRDARSGRMKDSGIGLRLAPSASWCILLLLIATPGLSEKSRCRLRLPRNVPVCPLRPSRGPGPGHHRLTRLRINSARGMRERGADRPPGSARDARAISFIVMGTLYCVPAFRKQ